MEQEQEKNNCYGGESAGERKKLTSDIAEVASNEEEKQFGDSSLSVDNMTSRSPPHHDVRYGSFRLDQWPTDNVVETNTDFQDQRNSSQQHLNSAMNELCGERGYTNLALTNDGEEVVYNVGSPNLNCDRYNEIFSEKQKVFNVQTDGGSKLFINIGRDSYNQKDFDTIYGKEFRKDNLFTKISKHCRCSPVSFLLSVFPILSWLPKYHVKEWLLPDIITGFTLAILQIPQGMAYGLLATVGAINGLYVSFFPVIVYFLMGTSRHISIGTFAVISIMVSNAADKIGAVVSRDVTDNNVTNGSSEDLTGMEGTNLWPPTRFEVVITMAMVVGMIQLGMGMLKLGILSLILSDQLVSGFTTGAATHVATSQLKDLFGIRIPRHPGPLQLVYTYIGIFKELPESNVATIIVSAISIFLLAVVKEQINDRYRHKLLMPIPVDLFVTIAVTVASYYMNFQSEYNMSVMGDIPTGLPAPSLPRMDIGVSLIADSVSVGIVVFAICLSLGKLFAKRHGYSINPNQELIALGSANIVSSFFSCFPCAVSLSRSMVMERTGGKTQVAAFISCIFILIVLLFLSPLFYHLPKCILSCIILVALKGMFLQVKDFWEAWKVSRLDAIVWVVSFSAVVIISIDLGLLIGVAFSLFVVLMRIVFPNKSLLGNIPNTEIYVDVERYKCTELPDIKIFHFGGALCFLNKDIFKSFLKENIPHFVLDQNSTPKVAKVQSFVEQRVLFAILDCSSFSFLDLSGKDMLVEIENELREAGITLILAECTVPVYEMLERTDFLAKPDDKGHPKIFPTVHDAVTYCRSTYTTNL